MARFLSIREPEAIMVGAKVISLQRHSTPEVYVLPQRHFWMDSLGLREPQFAVATTIYIRNYLEEVCDSIWCMTNITGGRETRQGLELAVDQNSLEAITDQPKGLRVRYFQLDQGKASEVSPQYHLPEDGLAMACLYSRRQAIDKEGHFIDSPLPGLYTRHPTKFPNVDLFYSGTHPLRDVTLLIGKERWNQEGMKQAIDQYLQSMYKIEKASISFPGRPKKSKVIREWKDQEMESVPNAFQWVFLSVSTKALPVLIPSVEERYRRVLGDDDVGKAVYDGEHGRFTLMASRDKMYCSITAHSDAPGLQRRRLFSSLGGSFKRSLRVARSQKRDVGQNIITAVEI